MKHKSIYLPVTESKLPQTQQKNYNRVFNQDVWKIIEKTQTAESNINSPLMKNKFYRKTKASKLKYVLPRHATDFLRTVAWLEFN